MCVCERGIVCGFIPAFMCAGVLSREYNHFSQFAGIDIDAKWHYLTHIGQVCLGGLYS